MKYILAVIMFGLFGCGTFSERSEDIPGSAGIQGINGINSLVATQRFTSNISLCASGAGVLLNSGLDNNRDDILQSFEVTSTTVVCDGSTGAQGSAGISGSNGVSCTVQPIIVSASAPTGGALLQCGLTQVVVYNGSANAAAAMLQVVQQITPCGPNSSPWKEVLLQLAGGSLIGTFSDNASGLNTRLSDIPDGSYIDTDNSGCNFSVSTSGSNRSISWNTGSNSYSTWSAQTITWPIL